MKHNKKAKKVDTVPKDIMVWAERMKESEYWIYLEELRKKVVRKKVINSEVGKSGFILMLEDGTWVLSYLTGNHLKWKVGDGEPTEEVLKYLNCSNHGDASISLIVDLPYAKETCNIAQEIKQSHQQIIVGIAYGENNFNFCFPGGYELDTMLVPDNNGVLSLRVFWELW